MRFSISCFTAMDVAACVEVFWLVGAALVTLSGVAAKGRASMVLGRLTGVVGGCDEAGGGTPEDGVVEEGLERYPRAARVLDDVEDVEVMTLAECERSCLPLRLGWLWAAPGSCSDEPEEVPGVDRVGGRARGELDISRFNTGR